MGQLLSSFYHNHLIDVSSLLVIPQKHFETVHLWATLSNVLNQNKPRRRLGAIGIVLPQPLVESLKMLCNGQAKVSLPSATRIRCSQKILIWISRYLCSSLTYNSFPHHPSPITHHPSSSSSSLLALCRRKV